MTMVLRAVPRPPVQFELKTSPGLASVPGSRSLSFLGLPSKLSEWQHEGHLSGCCCAWLSSPLGCCHKTQRDLQEEHHCA